MPITVQIFLNCFFALLFLSACGVESDLGEMKQTTQEMQTTTEQMNQKTTQMLDNAEQLTRATEELKRMAEEMKALTESLEWTAKRTYMDLRQAQAADMRRSLWQSLDQTSRLESKLIEAGKYLFAFEFQSWTGKNRDSLLVREMLLSDAVEEFLSKAYGEVSTPLKINLRAKDNSSYNIFALALTMHRLNHFQVTPEGVVPESMMDLIFDGLKQRQLIWDGVLTYENLRPYQREVLKHEELALHLLRLRQNLTAMFVMVRLSSLKNGGNWLEQAYHATAMNLKPWTASLMNTNSIQTQWLAELKGDSVQVAKRLMSMGDDPQTDKFLIRMAQNLRWPSQPQQDIDFELPFEKSLQNLRKSHREFLDLFK